MPDYAAERRLWHRFWERVRPLSRCLPSCGASATNMSDPCQMVWGDKFSIVMASPKNADSSSTFNDLKTAFVRTERPPSNQDRPTFPGSMHVPGFAYARVDSIASDFDPMPRIECVSLNTITVALPCGHREERFQRDHLDLPFKPFKLN